MAEQEGKTTKEQKFLDINQLIVEPFRYKKYKPTNDLYTLELKVNLTEEQYNELKKTKILSIINNEW